MTPAIQAQSTTGSRLKKVAISIALVFISVLSISIVAISLSDQLNKARLKFDRQNLHQLLESFDYDNDVVRDSYLLSATGGQPNIVNYELLGLRRDRLAYIAKQEDEVVAIVVPATAEDGFNGHVDLLIAVDMLGHIGAARVIRDLNDEVLHGAVDVIESQWMKEFTGNSMRDILRISWQTIEADNEYDQFVGASVTPRTVSDRIYDALVFVQSNRITLMNGDN